MKLATPTLAILVKSTWQLDLMGTATGGGNSLVRSGLLDVRSSRFWDLGLVAFVRFTAFGLDRFLRGVVLGES